jgi:phosphopantothenoylcysteine decarboxylase/phosphopantothenate--cysteine ligase
LRHISNHNLLRPKLVIGFASETSELEKNSQKKLLEKNCDWIIANDISNADIGFDSEYNEVSIFYKNMKKEKIPKIEKSIVADEIVKRVIEQIN